MTGQGQFRLERGLLHAGLVLLVVVAVTATIAVAFDVADPQRFGQSAGCFAVFVTLGAFGVSYLAQTGRPLAFRITDGALVALVAPFGLLACSTTGEPHQPSPPTPTSTLVRADGELRHPTFGFSVPDPGASLIERPDLAAQFLPSDGSVRGWVYGDEAAGELVVVATAAATDEQAFSEFFSGMMTQQLISVETAGMTADERERSLSGADRRAHAFVVTDTLYMRFDAFGLPGGRAFYVSSMATTAERFAALADGIQRP